MDINSVDSLLLAEKYIEQKKWKGNISKERSRQLIRKELELKKGRQLCHRLVTFNLDKRFHIKVHLIQDSSATQDDSKDVCDEWDVVESRSNRKRILWG